MMDKILGFIEEYAIKVSTWCWHKRLELLNKKRNSKK